MGRAGRPLSSEKNFLLMGRPGVGKTTVIQAVARLFPGQAGGFVTGEIRERGARKGFSVTSLSGESAVMAHVDFAGPVRVGKYGIDVPAFERIAIPSLRDALQHKKIAVIDEIGKMEIASPRFFDLVLQVFDSPLVVVATVMERSHPFADGLKKRADVQMIEVTRENRDRLPARIAGIVGELMGD